jgi:hypothetical protein
MPGWSAEDTIGPITVCAHIWSREMGVRVRRQPFALSICEWCGKTRLRTVDPTKLDATLRSFGEAA